MMETIDGGESRLVNLLLDSEDAVPRELDLRISLADDMLRYAIACHDGDRDQGLATYFLTGLSTFRTWGRVLRWHFDSLSRISSLLDFAAGYGRVSRFLAAALPPETLVVSDVDAGALEFQRRCFGVSTLPSEISPEHFAPGRSFECIVVTSLLTHLPERRFTAWLRRLWEHVEAGGLLVFTTHDRTLLPGDHRGRDLEFTFVPTSESRSLARDEYGTAWVSPGFVERCLDALPGPISFRRVPRGLSSFHDVTIAVRRADVDLSTLVIDRELAGRLELCRIEPDGWLELGGWAADAGGLGPPGVRISMDGQEFATARSGGSRPDVSEGFEGYFGPGYGWFCEGSVDGPGVDGSTPLVVRLTADDGRHQVVFAGSLHSALLAASRERLSELERDLDTCQERVEWMERSRFWRLRNRWFELKRALRLTDEE